MGEGRKCVEVPMKHLKIYCDFCRGGIEFPRHAGGRAINCPHCAQAIILRRNSKWVDLLKLSGLVAVIATVVIAGIFNKRQNTKVQSGLTFTADDFETNSTSQSHDSSQYVVRPPIVIAPLPLVADNGYLTELRRANDLTEKALQQRRFDSLDESFGRDDANDSAGWQNFYRLQQNNLLQRQTADLDQITEIYRLQYNDSLYQPER